MSNVRRHQSKSLHAVMRVCPKCSATVFTGATDCARCGHVLTGSDPVVPVVLHQQEEPHFLGSPSVPPYRKPPNWLPALIGVAGVAMVVIGTHTALSPGSGNCSGRGSFLCSATSKLHLVLFGSENPKLAEGALFIASGLFFWAVGWHLHSMWFRAKRDA
jgi:hypothetical protein